MKKIIILATAIFAALALSAQVKTTDYNYSNFKGISIDNEFVVTVSQGSEYKVAVLAEAPYVQYIKVGVSAGILEISLDEKSVPTEVKKLYKGANPPFKANITVPESLKSYTLKGKSELTVLGDVTSADPVSISVGENAVLKPIAITSTALSIDMEKKGSADVTFNGEKVTVAASGSSSLNLTRETDASDIALSGSANLVLRGTSSSMAISTKGTSKAALNGKTQDVEYTLGGTSNINAIGLEVQNAKVNMSGLCSLTEAASFSLKINISSGASLVFDGQPAIEIENIKNSSVSHYNSK